MNQRFGEWVRDHAPALLTLSLVALFAAPCVYACEVTKAVALVRLAEGAWIEYEDSRLPLQGGERVCIGSQLIVPGPGRIQVELSQNSIRSPQASPPIINLGSHSSLRFRPPINQTNWLLELVDGWFRFFSPRPTSIDVKAGYLTAGVRGTEFVVQTQRDGCSHLKDPDSVPGCDALWVQEGTVAACPNDPHCRFEPDAPGLVLVRAETDAEMADAARRTLLALPGRKLRLGRLDVHPDDAVNWVLRYPPLARLELPDCDARLQVPGGLLACGTANEVSRNWRQLSTRADHQQITIAALNLIQAGYHADALSMLRTLAAERKDPELYALLSVIALKTNDLDQAQGAADAALQIEPRSANALLARSYLQQARFELSDARVTAQRAAKQAPEEPLIATRLAELSLAMEESALAVEQATIAVRLADADIAEDCRQEPLEGPARDATLSRACSILGFAHLIRSDTDSAHNCLSLAAAADNLAPLPKLGLGLLAIRRGDLDGGVRLLERAVALDPRVSLYRSYLGKGYFEQDEYELAEKELRLAKRFDPADPTPWLYDALRLQTVNDPIGAFAAIEASKARNDQRAVYRSRLLLDDDLAARQANLGRIYDRLGFEQLALLEGANSVVTDPGNYSGHRLLSDGYAVKPRHQIARVSELLQAQLRQPLNVAAIPAHRLETDLNIVDQSGPGSASYNEYTTLFRRDGVSLQASALAGSQQTLGDEIILFGTQDNVAFSASQYHYETQGTRANNDLTTDLGNLFGQLQLTPETRIQAEYRYRRNRSGDLQQLFDRDSFLPTLRENDTNRLWRVGLFHGFSPNSDLLANVVFQDNDFELDNPSDDPFFPDHKLSLREQARQYEVQHLLSSERMHVISGAGYSRVSVTADDSIFGPSQERVRHSNAYVYAPVEITDGLVFTFGLSGDIYEGFLVDREQLNPKLGMTWSVTDDTRIRAAGFRTLKRTLISDQTLEPTTIAGFNQFFDDRNGSSAWRVGVGLDHRASPRLHIGGEVSQRIMDAPTQTLDFSTFTSSVEEARHEELFLQGYLYMTPSQDVALRADYSFERLDREFPSFNPEGIGQLRTHSLLLEMQYFLPSRWAFSLRPTFIHQSGEFSDPANPGQVMGDSDSFWLLDMGVTYLLPKQRGSVSLNVKNLLDQDFQFQDIDRGNPRYLPERAIYGTITLTF